MHLPMSHCCYHIPIYLLGSPHSQNFNAPCWNWYLFTHNLLPTDISSPFNICHRMVAMVEKIDTPMVWRVIIPIMEFKSIACIGPPSTWTKKEEGTNTFKVKLPTVFPCADKGGFDRCSRKTRKVLYHTRHLCVPLLNRCQYHVLLLLSLYAQKYLGNYVICMPIGASLCNCSSLPKQSLLRLCVQGADTN